MKKLLFVLILSTLLLSGCFTPPPQKTEQNLTDLVTSGQPAASTTEDALPEKSLTSDGKEIDKVFQMAQFVPATADSDATTIPQPELQCRLTYKHVEPGKRSQVYLDFLATRARLNLQAGLQGPGIINAEKQAQSAATDYYGYSRITWDINKLGEYNVNVTMIDELGNKKYCEATVTVE